MPDNPTDMELWERATRHDGGAFGQLFDRQSQAIYNHCFRRTASWSSAEDLTSIVWAEAWRRRKDVRLHSESILPWLLAVANNCLRNYQRSQRRHQKLLAELTHVKIGDFAEDSVNRLDDERRMAEVLSVLSELRVEDQEVIALCHWAGLSYAEVAEVIGVPIGTVRSRLSRAHGRLRTTLIIPSDDNRPLSARPLPHNPH